MSSPLLPATTGLQQTLTAAAAASASGPRFVISKGAPRPMPPPGTYKIIPLRVLPLPTLPVAEPPPIPTTYDVILMRPYNPASEAQVTQTYFDNTFTYDLPMNRTFPTYPDSLKLILGTYSSSTFVNDPSTLKFNSLVYMKNELSEALNNPELLPGTRMDDLVFLWGTDEDEDKIKSIEINVFHQNRGIVYNKADIAFLKHVIDFIPFYYQIVKYKNKLWQRSLQILKQILAKSPIPEINLNPPYPAPLVSGINKMDLLAGRIITNKSVENDFRNGIVFRVKFKSSMV